MKAKYFFPGRNKQSLCAVDTTGMHTEKIGKCGQATAALEGMLINTDVYALEVSAQSPKGAGVLIEFIPNPIPNRYDTGLKAEGWEWVEFDEGLIGWPTGEPLESDHLLRKKPIAGLEVSDSNGGTWVIPTTRGGKQNYGSLPVEWFMTKKGWDSRVEDETQPILGLASEVEIYLRALSANILGEAALDPKFADPYGLETALKVLGINYHIGMSEALLFQEIGQSPFNPEFTCGVLNALLNNEVVRELTAKRREQRREADAVESLAGDVIRGGEVVEPIVA